MPTIAGAAPGPATAPAAIVPVIVAADGICRRLASQSSLGSPQTEGAADRSAAPKWSRENGLLQVGHRGQVGRELDDASSTAPVRTCPERIVPGNGGGSDLSIESTREDAAITLRQVGVGVAQVQRKHLVGKADADVPGVVISIMDAIRERRGPVEAVGGCKPLPPELAGDIHANAAGAEDRRRSGEFAGDRSIVAPGA